MCTANLIRLSDTCDRQRRNIAQIVTCILQDITPNNQCIGKHACISMYEYLTFHSSRDTVLGMNIHKQISRNRNSEIINNIVILKWLDSKSYGVVAL